MPFSDEEERAAPEAGGSQHGDATIRLLHALFDRGVRHAVALVRHSAREFEPGRHDLDNPLTVEGRQLALRLGRALPAGLTVRAYASPPERCMETASLVLAGYADAGGRTTRHRPVEGLGVFYALDQMKMWKGMTEAGGMQPYLEAWFRDELPADAMMPAGLAARLVLRVMTEKLRSPVAERQLDLCVSHDMTLHLLRDRLLGQGAGFPPVAFLDALVAYRLRGRLWLASHHGEPVAVDDEVTAR